MTEISPFPASREDHATAPITVLVVDDHPRVRAALEWLVCAASDLALLGSACGGQEAVRLAAKLQPEVIVMDLAMPGVSGVDATRQIRTQPRPPAVIALSGSHELRDDAVAAGAAFSLLKDVDPAELLAVIRVAAGRPGRL
jgi:DNA-binding NarL/FixJ family response regulator